MKNALIITDHKDTFITALPIHTNLNDWAFNWIRDNDRDIKFWNSDNISIDRINNEINIFGGNGMVCLHFQFFSV